MIGTASSTRLCDRAASRLNRVSRFPDQAGGPRPRQEPWSHTTRSSLSLVDLVRRHDLLAGHVENLLTQLDDDDLCPGDTPPEPVDSRSQRRLVTPVDEEQDRVASLDLDRLEKRRRPTGRQNRRDVGALEESPIPQPVNAGVQDVLENVLPFRERAPARARHAPSSQWRSPLTRCVPSPRAPRDAPRRRDALPPRRSSRTDRRRDRRG